jgi:hypothetical protein
LYHTLIPSYQNKCQILCQAIDHYNNHVPQRHTLRIVVRPTGGYFLWLQLPYPIQATEFLQYCHEKQPPPPQNLIKTNRMDDVNDYQSTSSGCNLNKSIHFMIGSRCDAVLKHQQKQKYMSRFQYGKSQNNPSSLSSSDIETADELDDDLSPYIRLCFAYMDTDQIQDGITLLLHKLHQYCTTVLVK